MSDSKDLVEKADAFLKRYHPAPTSAREDVPVLTEVVAEATPSPPPAGSTASTAPAKTQLTDLEQKLRQSLLDAIAPRVASILEEPLRIRVEAHLKRALPALADQIKLDIEALVRDAVARAVEQEVARLRGPSRNSRS
ncbi:MAG TPA: hypothetical protein VH867_09355 [Burkholderiales bacterium]|jgi:hypothetical protein